LFEACCRAQIDPAVQSCEAAVGTGKTTAVMAFLLRAAKEKGLRRIFVVLPYTNIIRQAVQVYRDALVLDGEDPQEVVAELHHLADFERPESRQLAAVWKSPVIVTTAVQFFETIAGNLPARVRKLHELPGSAVFVDEAHAAIPTGLWPQTGVG
jgi:CRISPR/Cas system-associated endonuclease/helicase Cas3